MRLVSSFQFQVSSLDTLTLLEKAVTLLPVKK